MYQIRARCWARSWSNRNVKLCIRSEPGAGHSISWNKNNIIDTNYVIGITHWDYLCNWQLLVMLCGISTYFGEHDLTIFPWSCTYHIWPFIIWVGLVYRVAQKSLPCFRRKITSEMLDLWIRFSCIFRYKCPILQKY